MSDNIKVGIRLRPLNKCEKDENLPIQWIVRGNCIVSLNPVRRKQEENTFQFDDIYDMDAINSNVFDAIAKPIVDSVLNGINGTIFSYGQSNSGKTYTMLGTIEEPGIIPLSIKYIFDVISNVTDREFLLRASCLEIYDEMINDLLNLEGLNLKLRKDDNECIVVNCKEEPANSFDTMLHIMEKGFANGNIRGINKEKHSNSHKIFRIVRFHCMIFYALRKKKLRDIFRTIESQEVGEDTKNVIQISQLNLVDLAGFKKPYEADNSEKRQIDASLFTLESIIMQLSGSQKDKKEISYHESKLTELLQPAIGGNSSTAIIFTVVPVTLEETYDVLLLALQTKNVKNSPCKNEIVSDTSLLISHKKQIEKLQAELQRGRNEKSSGDIVSNTNHEESFKCKLRKRQLRPCSGTLKQHLFMLHNKIGLSTVIELSPEKSHRESNTQPNHILQQTFSDIESDLIDCETDSEIKENRNGNAIEEDRANSVNMFEMKSRCNSFSKTPSKRDLRLQALSHCCSPSTPKNVLRQHISDLTRDLIELREFTTLEKQLICEENHCNPCKQLTNSTLSNSDDHNENYVYCSSLMKQLEDEKDKLAGEVELKVLELNEIKNDVVALKSDAEQLQNTIYLLTNENMDMSNKLESEKKRSKEVESNLQNTIDDLYDRISKVTDEKINLESSVTDLNEQLQSIRSKIPETVNDEQLFSSYQCKINELKTENIELTSIIAEKNRELENIKESKSLLYNHDCIYKDELITLKENNQYLVKENNELSTDLIDKIEENDTLKEQNDILKNKISLMNNVNSEDDDMDRLKTENNFLKAEILELKMKVTMLSTENANFSNNLLESIDNPNNSRKENLNSLAMFNDTMKTDETVKRTLQEEDHEVLVNQVIELQKNIDRLTHMNEKLSNLKLASCSQCAHLKNLNDSRRAFKLEAKILNRKVEELQRKYDRKCADTEALKMKVNQDLNLSSIDLSLNSSFTNGMNVSFVEEKVQLLSNELLMLKDDRDKLSLMYKEKCDELEKLEAIDAKNVDEDSKSKKHGIKNECRIEKIQQDIDQVREDIDEMKKNSMNFHSMLNKFRTEKVNLLDEINKLKTSNDVLQEKVSNSEASAAAAVEKAQILENDLAQLSKELEEFNAKEKMIKSEKLTLELEIEDLKHEKGTKDVEITNLHRAIDDLNECISSLKTELDLAANEKKELTNSTDSIERKYKNELESLKKQCEKLEKERKQSVDAGNRAALYAKELERTVEKLQADLNRQESFHKDVQGKVSQLEHLLQETESEKEELKQKLQELEAQVTDSKDNLAAEYKNEVTSVTKKLEDYTKESEMKLMKINETLNKYIEENDNLTQEITKLRDIESKFHAMKVNSDSFGKEESLKEQLDTVRESMIKELTSLKHKVNSMCFLNKTANDIFIILLQALVSKEEEVIKGMRETFEKDKQKLEDEKRQCADTEKRVTLWTKELETEIEKLQTDLTERENMNKIQQDKVCQLEYVLRECNYEKQLLKEKMETLDSDYHNLQAELDKQRKTDVRQEEAINIVQKKEKEMQEAFKNKETELQLKVKSEKETYEKRIEELLATIETYKTKNMELKSNIECLEANTEQMKNIIEVNASEIKINHQTIQRIKTDMEQLTEAYNEATREVEQKTTRIEDITALLKSKCDMLSEYKTKLDSITPDYLILKDQVKEWKASIERYKEEIETLKMEKDKEINVVKDQLNSEEIQNHGLNTQLNEVNNKNASLVEELDTLKEKYENLQRLNVKLEKRIRNSTSKIKADAEIEDLKDVNKRLQNNLEGASNRISELQDTKNKILKELVNLKGQYELLTQENVKIKKTLTSYKTRQNTPSYLQDDSSYNALLQEKNKVALELESRKLLVNQRDKEIKDYASQVKDLSIKNQNLNSQLEKCIANVRERDQEIANLKEKLYVHQIENKLVNELDEKLNILRTENKKLHGELEMFKTKSQTDTKQIEDIKLHNEKVLRLLRKENSELQAKLNEYENKLESKSSSGSSRSVSPGFEANRRRHSRNEIFNQKRQLGSMPFVTNVNEDEETCQILRKKIQELELQLVSKNGQIAALEIQIQSENFPYQQKCKELEEFLLVQKSKNSELKSKVRKLQETLNDINGWDCDTCRKWRINRRDQGCQTMSNNTSRLLETNNDHLKIMRLEKEKTVLRDLFRSRCRRIKDLEDKIKEFEETQSTLVTRPRESEQEISNHTYASSLYFNKQLNLESGES